MTVCIARVLAKRQTPSNAQMDRYQVSNLMHFSLKMWHPDFYPHPPKFIWSIALRSSNRIHAPDRHNRQKRQRDMSLCLYLRRSLKLMNQDIWAHKKSRRSTLTGFRMRDEHSSRTSAASTFPWRRYRALRLFNVVDTSGLQHQNATRPDSALSMPAEHRLSQTTYLHLQLCASALNFLQLYLYQADHCSF